MRPRLFTHWMPLLILTLTLITTACTEPNPNLVNDTDTNIPQSTDTSQNSDTNDKTDASNTPDTTDPSDTPEITDTNDQTDTSPSSNTECTTFSDCPPRQFCNEDKTCTKATSCQQIECAQNERCLPVNLACIHDCISDATLCTDGQVCNSETAKCQNPGCINPTATPDSCSDTTPNYDPETCSCVACLDNDHCHPEETCSSTNTCIRTDCETTCDVTQAPTTCSGQTPYCTNGCCSECIGSADCSAPDICIQGTCAPPPVCDTSDPNACPTGQFCDSESKICTPAGNGDGCGLCNPDCSCPNDLVCDGFACTGCTVQIGDESECPEGTQCYIGGFCGPKII